MVMFSLKCVLVNLQMNLPCYYILSLIFIAQNVLQARVLQPVETVQEETVPTTFCPTCCSRGSSPRATSTSSPQQSLQVTSREHVQLYVFHDKHFVSIAEQHQKIPSALR